MLSDELRNGGGLMRGWTGFYGAATAFTFREVPGRSGMTEATADHGGLLEERLFIAQHLGSSRHPQPPLVRQGVAPCSDGGVAQIPIPMQGCRSSLSGHALS